MPIIFDLGGTDVSVAANLGDRLNRILPALVDKMTQLMQKLQLKAQSKTKGRIAESIRDPQATVEGTTVIGSVDWGGVDLPPTAGQGVIYDLAKIYEYGTTLKLYPINPIGEATGLTGPGQKRGGTPGKAKGVKRMFGKDVLSFRSAGFEQVVAYVTRHPGTEAQHFMQSSLDGMKREIIEGLMETITDFGKGKY